MRSERGEERVSSFVRSPSLYGVPHIVMQREEEEYEASERGNGISSLSSCMARRRTGDGRGTRDGPNGQAATATSDGEREGRRAPLRRK